MQMPFESPKIIKSVSALCFMQDPVQRPDFEALLKMLAPTEKPPKPSLEEILDTTPHPRNVAPYIKASVVE